MAKKKTALIIVGGILIVAGVLYSKHRHTSFAGLQVSGIVEAPEVNVSSMIPGRIVKMTCKEGDAVEKGVSLIELDNNELKAAEGQAKAQIERAKADILVANATVESARANIESIKAESRSAQAVLDKAKALLANADRDKDRYTALSKEQAVARSAYDTVITTYEAARAEADGAKAKLSQEHARMNSALAQMDTAKSQNIAALANLKQAEAGLALAQARLEQSVILSPLSGTVVYKALEEGEAVSAGMTILTLVDLHQLTVRIDVEETHIGELTLNQSVTIISEGGSGKSFSGKIISINPYAEFATQKDVTRGRQDIKTFKVNIHVDDPDGFLKPGMTVDVNVPAKGGV